MAEQPVDIIRESTRNNLNINRRFRREKQSNSLRSIDDISVTAEVIKEIANKLKTKLAISAKELQILKNGLMNDQKYIELVLKTHGALRGIIRELTGPDVKKQCEAAGCCCNLALGDSKACMAVAKDAGTYLTAELDSLTSELAASMSGDHKPLTCAWTIGNLAGSGPRVCSVLISQGALAKLSAFHNNKDLQDAALYALTHFAYQMKDELRGDYLSKIMNTLSQLSVTVASSQLLFLLSCHTDFPQYVPEELVLKILKELPVSIESHLTCYQNKMCCKFIYLIRILANLNMHQYYSVIMSYFLLNNISVAINRVLSLNNVTVNNSLLWLLGNLYNHSDSEFFAQLIS